MQAIITGLQAGFIVGVVCVVYVLLRSWYINMQLENSPMDTAEFRIASTNWMVMAFFSSASVVWGFIGAGIYHLIKSEVTFALGSLIAAVVLSLIFLVSNVRNKGDKAFLTFAVLTGLGVLIPYLY